MTKLDRAKKVVSEHCRDAYCGIFDCPNFVGAYFEVFGLTKQEFSDLKKFYLGLRGW